MADDATIQDLHRKIAREKNIIFAANHMRQATNNAQVNSRVDSNIRDATRNMQYFESILSDIEERKLGDGVSNMSISGNGGPPRPPQHRPSASQSSQAGAMGMSGQQYSTQGDYGAPGPGGYSGGGGQGLMPPRAPYAPPGPADRPNKARPNYSKLGMCEVRSEGVRWKPPTDTFQI